MRSINHFLVNIFINRLHFWFILSLLLDILHLLSKWTLCKKIFVFIINFIGYLPKHYKLYLYLIEQSIQTKYILNNYPTYLNLSFHIPALPKWSTQCLLSPSALHFPFIEVDNTYWISTIVSQYQIKHSSKCYFIIFCFIW